MRMSEDARGEKKERKDTMAAISKPLDRAFVLDVNQAPKFFSKKNHTSSEVLNRFESRKNKSTAVVKTERR